MRALVQRVQRASVTVSGEVVGAIGPGLCVLVGVTHSDTLTEASRLASKVWNLRCFDDDAGAMNLSLADIGGQILIVSQFTLYANTVKGRRPSWNAAAPASVAEPLVDVFADELRNLGAQVATGAFGAHMQVSLVNDGPVTVLLEI